MHRRGLRRTWESPGLKSAVLGRVSTGRRSGDVFSVDLVFDGWRTLVHRSSSQSGVAMIEFVMHCCTRTVQRSTRLVRVEFGMVIGRKNLCGAGVCAI